MKKRGFTLVELLAVIAILAILVIMALPAVLKMYNKARRDTFNNELNTIIRTAKQQYLLSGGQAGIYSKDSNPLSLTGNSSLNYCITINGQGQITNLQATNGSYKYESNGIVSETNSDDISEINGGFLLDCGPIKYVNRQNEGSITAGDEVAIDTEHFYVISSNSTNTVLLSKYDLKQESGNYIQDMSGTDTNIVKAVFLKNDNNAYWDGKQCTYNNNWSCTGTPAGLISPYSDGGASYCTSLNGTNCAYVYDDNTANIYAVVNQYASKIRELTGINVTARLIKVEETTSHEQNIKKDMNGYFYWLGSAYDYNNIWTLGHDGSYRSVSASNVYAVRPVIEVPTSSMPN